MLGKISVALLLAASPALAAEPAPAEPGQPQAAGQQYKTKRVCRSVEVVGSSIPRTTCTTKKIPIKPVEPEASAESDQPSQAEAPESE